MNKRNEEWDDADEEWGDERDDEGEQNVRCPAATGDWLGSAVVARPIQIVPSVLPADFSRLGEEVAALEAAGVDLIQWDVMDGQFVPNLTFGPDVIKSASPTLHLPFEAHLMVYTPDVMAQQYVDAGCSRLIVHAEACTHLHRTLANINSMGARAAVALNPATPASSIEHVLDLVDLVLVMTVNPGFGGQSVHRDDGAKDRRGTGDARRDRAVGHGRPRGRRGHRPDHDPGRRRGGRQRVDRRQRSVPRSRGPRARRDRAAGAGEAARP